MEVPSQGRARTMLSVKPHEEPIDENQRSDDNMKEMSLKPRASPDIVGELNFMEKLHIIGSTEMKLTIFIC